MLKWVTAILQTVQEITAIPVIITVTQTITVIHVLTIIHIRAIIVPQLLHAAIHLLPVAVHHHLLLERAALHQAVAAAVVLQGPQDNIGSYPVQDIASLL